MATTSLAKTPGGSRNQGNFVATRTKKLAEAEKLPKSEIIPPQQMEFIEAYLIERNATAAAIKAGYSKASAHAQGCHLLKTPKVRDELARRAMEIARQTNIEGARVLEEIASIAFAPITKGYINANDKLKALDMLGIYLRLWEGSAGNKTIQINILPSDRGLI